MLFDLAALWLITWMFKNAAMDVMYAGSGKPNPRYELKKARAKAAGQAEPVQPRYGGRDWFADLLADGLQAQTDWRRKKAAEKRQARDEAGQQEQEQQQEQEGQAQPGRPGAPVPGPDLQAAGDAQEPVHPADVVIPKGWPVTSREPDGRWSWSCRYVACPGGGFDFASKEAAQAAVDEHLRRFHPGELNAGARVPGGTPDASAPAADPAPGAAETAADQTAATTRPTPPAPAPAPDPAPSPQPPVPAPAADGSGPAAGPAPTAAAAPVPVPSGPRPGPRGYRPATDRPAEPAEDWDRNRAIAGQGAVTVAHDLGRDCGRPDCWACADEHRRGSCDEYPVRPLPGTPVVCPTCGGPIDAMRRFHGADPGRLVQLHCVRCGWSPRCGLPDEPPKTSGPRAGGAPDPEQHPIPRPAPPADDSPTAQIIPFRSTHQEDTVNPEITTEVQGLTQSLAYTQNLAAMAGEHGQSGNEGYISHLTGQKVEGEALTTAAAMQEAFSLAQAAAEAHAEELIKQMPVQEGYGNNPDAGDKEYQISGQ